MTALRSGLTGTGTALHRQQWNSPNSAPLAIIRMQLLQIERWRASGPSRLIHTPTCPIMVSLWSLLFPLLFLPSALYARSSSADDILVMIEPNLPRSKFSIFFENLKGSHPRSLATCPDPSLSCSAGIQPHFSCYERDVAIDSGG